MTLPVIAITMGDPAGVGPEICLRALSDGAVLECCEPVVIGNAEVLRTLAGRLGLPFNATILHRDDVDHGFAPGGPAVVDMHILVIDDFTPGTVDRVCGHAAYEYITFAVDRALAGEFDAMVTAPICKEALDRAAVLSPGHTEILQHQTDSPDVVMMLHSPRVTVSLVTTHMSLSDVPRHVTRTRVERVIELTDRMMRRILGHSPRIAVLGLNPHGGEGGMFGREEIDEIRPAIDSLITREHLIEGPLPADTAFTPAALQRYDAHVAMYHDQGLAPFKALSFEDGVNVTLGIPIIRTSVDHGTAFDIAWQGKADHTSLVAAVKLAAKLAAQRPPS
jgi:4-hydroxythreonine-4-phosphate dehydrogenase